MTYKEKIMKEALEKIADPSEYFSKSIRYVYAFYNDANWCKKIAKGVLEEIKLLDFQESEKEGISSMGCS